MVSSFNEVLERARGVKKKIAVVCPYKKTEVDAIDMAMKEGVAEPIFVGEKKKIEEVVKGSPLENVEVISVKDDTEAVINACSLIRDGKANAIMKGHLATSTFLKGILDKERGLYKGRILSHIVVLSLPAYLKLMFVTDGGMNPHPDIETKVGIVQNAIEFAKSLGIENPKVALLAGVETISDNQPETVDSAVIVKMAERGQITGAVIDGPIAMDIAVSKEAGQIKGVESPIAGETDIFVVPTMAAGNIMAKALIHLAGAEAGGIVVGAQAPVILLSRSDDAMTKLRSVALGVIQL
ncbi:MAG: bifunctional enoyl-CoA hydratase/phosphate acetyltransferase [bacterium]